MGLVNLEIRAGTPRDDALRNLAARTDLEDVRALTTVLIQTERFGTSVGQALRVQSDTLRTKRRQRVEEASAKTAIKMLFPLVFCIFPAMYLVILGPGVLQALKVLGDMACHHGSGPGVAFRNLAVTSSSPSESGWRIGGGPAPGVLGRQPTTVTAADSPCQVTSRHDVPHRRVALDADHRWWPPSAGAGDRLPPGRRMALASSRRELH
jgi:hypothetical protein